MEMAGRHDRQGRRELPEKERVLIFEGLQAFADVFTLYFQSCFFDKPALFCYNVPAPECRYLSGPDRRTRASWNNRQVSKHELERRKEQ